MALGSKKSEGLVNPQGQPLNRPKTPKGGDFVETLVSWVFKILTFPLHIVTVIIGQMLTPGASGATFIGKVLFIFLTVLSSDSYWQILFQNAPLFPWYEASWTGWGWLPQIQLFPPGISLGLFANPVFYIAIAISFVIQLFESACFNGDKFFNVNPRLVGLIAITFWGFDLIMTFASRSPWRYTEPMDVLMCILFNTFTIFCAELGRWGEKVLSGKA